MNAIDPNPTAKNHRGNRFFSVSISNWLLASNAAFFLLSGLALAASIAIFLLTRASDRAKDRELRRQQFVAAQAIEQAHAAAEVAKADAARASQAAGEANERAAEANKEAARANVRAGELAVKAAEFEKEMVQAKDSLEKLRTSNTDLQDELGKQKIGQEKITGEIGGRNITEHQYNTIVSALRADPRAKTAYIEAYNSTDFNKFGDRLIKSFENGGVQLTLAYIGSSAAAVYGVEIYASPDSWAPAALSSGGIEFVLYAPVGNEVRIRIGLKRPRM